MLKTENPATTTTNDRKGNQSANKSLTNNEIKSPTPIYRNNPLYQLINNEGKCDQLLIARQKRQAAAKQSNNIITTGDDNRMRNIIH